MRSPVVPTPVDHDEVLRSLARETAVLLDRVLGEFLDLDLDREPVLEDFTAGQVLTYLSREADRMADELLVATGRPLPPHDADRRWDLDRGGLRPGAVLIEDFVESSERLSEAIASVGDWSTLDDPVRSIPGRRLIQLIVHHADLSRPWNELPAQDASIAVRLLPSVMAEELADISLEVAPAEHSSMLSKTGDGLTVVEGDPRMMLAWVSGRRFPGDPVDVSLPDLGTRIWF